MEGVAVGEGGPGAVRVRAGLGGGGPAGGGPCGGGPCGGGPGGGGQGWGGKGGSQNFALFFFPFPTLFFSIFLNLFRFFVDL